MVSSRTWFIVATTFKYIGKLFIGQESADQLGGPIAMAKAAGDAASVGFVPVHLGHRVSFGQYRID